MPKVRCEQVDGRFPEAAPRECGKIYSDDKAQWGASAGTWKLCSGLFLLQPGNASLDFVDRWAERLANKQAGAKNQPHYNAALAQSNLSATVLPCDLLKGMQQWEVSPDVMSFSVDINACEKGARLMLLFELSMEIRH